MKKSEQNKSLKYFMKEAHHLAKIISKNNSLSYKENLSIAMRAKYIGKKRAGESNIDDINYIKNHIPSKLIFMWSIQDFKRTSQFTINVPTYIISDKLYDLIEIKQHLVVNQDYMNNVIENRTETQRYLD